MLDPDLLAQYRQELRRGSTAVACLALLAAAPDHGYHLLNRLADLGLATEANTLYPLLRRLEKQGLLTFEWDTTEARPRKVYSAATAGIALIAVLRDDWDRISQALHQIGPPS